MDERLSANLAEHQNRLVTEMKKTYSDAVIDHALNPRNMGNLVDADGTGQITGPCGDTMQIWLKVKNDKIIDAVFTTDGCGTTRACGSIVTEIAQDKEISQALGITREFILEQLGGLPEEDQHCALLAANTLNSAVRNYLEFKREPWKKAYRK
jgi:nitrogen fixation NifU-like protein